MASARAGRILPKIMVVISPQPFSGGGADRSVRVTKSDLSLQIFFFINQRKYSCSGPRLGISSWMYFPIGRIILRLLINCLHWACKGECTSQASLGTKSSPVSKHPHISSQKNGDAVPGGLSPSLEHGSQTEASRIGKGSVRFALNQISFPENSIMLILPREFYGSQNSFLCLVAWSAETWMSVSLNCPDPSFCMGFFICGRISSFRPR